MRIESNLHAHNNLTVQQCSLMNATSLLFSREALTCVLIGSPRGHSARSLLVMWVCVHGTFCGCIRFCSFCILLQMLIFICCICIISAWFLEVAFLIYFISFICLLGEKKGKTWFWCWQCSVCECACLYSHLFDVSSWPKY